MISASHNPYMDNGIKVFGGTGAKLEDRLEEAVEARLGDVAAEEPLTGEAIDVQVSMRVAYNTMLTFSGRLFTMRFPSNFALV